MGYLEEEERRRRQQEALARFSQQAIGEATAGVRPLVRDAMIQYGAPGEQPAAEIPEVEINPYIYGREREFQPDRDVQPSAPRPPRERFHQGPAAQMAGGPMPAQEAPVVPPVQAAVQRVQAMQPGPRMPGAGSAMAMPGGTRQTSPSPLAALQEMPDKPVAQDEEMARARRRTAIQSVFQGLIAGLGAGVGVDPSITQATVESARNNPLSRLRAQRAGAVTEKRAEAERLYQRGREMASDTRAQSAEERAQGTYNRQTTAALREERLNDPNSEESAAARERAASHLPEGQRDLLDGMSANQVNELLDAQLESGRDVEESWLRRPNSPVGLLAYRERMRGAQGPAPGGGGGRARRREAGLAEFMLRHPEQYTSEATARAAFMALPESEREQYVDPLEGLSSDVAQYVRDRAGENPSRARLVSIRDAVTALPARDRRAVIRSNMMGEASSERILERGQEGREIEGFERIPGSTSSVSDARFGSLVDATADREEMIGYARDLANQMRRLSRLQQAGSRFVLSDEAAQARQTAGLLAAQVRNTALRLGVPTGRDIELADQIFQHDMSTPDALLNMRPLVERLPATLEAGFSRRMRAYGYRRRGSGEGEEAVPLQATGESGVPAEAETRRRIRITNGTRSGTIPEGTAVPPGWRRVGG